MLSKIVRMVLYLTVPLRHRRSKPPLMMLSILLGAAIAVAHGAAGMLVYRWAVRLPPMHGIKVATGGLVLRLIVALSAVVLVVTYVSVQVTAFVGALFAVFALMLYLDVLLMLRMSK